MFDEELNQINPLMAKIRRNEDVLNSIEAIISYLLAIKNNVLQVNTIQQIDIADIEQLMNEIQEEEKIDKNVPMDEITAPVSYLI